MKILYDGKHILSWGGVISKDQAAIEVSAILEGEVNPELISLTPDNASEIKSGIQGKVAERYGVGGDPVSAALSVIGKIGDATSLGVDLDVHDILAVEASKTSAYSKERIRLFEELHGENSWLGAVDFANQWHGGRVSKQIQMPFDDKGIAEVVTESADLGGFVKQLISDIRAPTEASQSETPEATT